MTIFCLFMCCTVCLFDLISFMETATSQEMLNYEEVLGPDSNSSIECKVLFVCF